MLYRGPVLGLDQNGPCLNHEPCLHLARGRGHQIMQRHSRRQSRELERQRHPQEHTVPSCGRFARVDSTRSKAKLPTAL